jgi:hypothetical protein
MAAFHTIKGRRVIYHFHLLRLLLGGMPDVSFDEFDLILFI